MIKKPTKERPNPGPNKWICVTCGYSCNSENVKYKHEEEAWFHNTPNREHEMEIHPEWYESKKR